MRAPEFWDAPPGLAAGLLRPLSAAWTAAGRLRRAAARKYRAPVPIVCIGNLVAGGSGKTPVALAILALLAERGVRVHAVTRGYGGRLRGPVQVDPRVHDAAEVGDEALLLAGRAPCWVARDRAAGIRSAVAAGAAAVVLDDGFQNPGFATDLAVLVVDAEHGFGNGRVIPAGPLREPVADGLARADAIVLIGNGDPPASVASTGLPLLRADFRPLDAARFTGARVVARVVAFAGIGRPAKFFASLRAAGAELAAAHSYPDHHRFSVAELDRLRRIAADANAGLVTTAKDWVRLLPDSRAGIACFEVEIGWRDPAAVAQLIGRAVPLADAPTKGLASRATR